MFSTPGDVRSFTFLLILFDLMQCEVHVFEFSFETLNNLISFFISTLLMFLHGEVDKILEFAFSMCS
jgi:hypothetical protein